MATTTITQGIEEYESAVSFSDGIDITGAITRATPVNIIDWDYISCPTPIVSTLTGAGGADGVMADGELF